MVVYFGNSHPSQCIISNGVLGVKRNNNLGLEIMQDFYIKDKNKNFAIRGMVPHNDFNCPPFDYFRLGHALNVANVYEDILKVKCPFQIPQELIRQFCLQKVDEMLKEMLESSKPNPKIHELLANNSLTKKEQEKLLHGLTLSATDLVWLNKESQEMGYLLDVYHEEKYHDKFNEKQHPAYFRKKDNGEVETVGKTDMTDGEMRAMLEQRKVVQARIYHKEPIWHCFYFTFKGLYGLECGTLGSQPHYHYLCDKSGISLDELTDRINKCDMPTSKVHIIINKDYILPGNQEYENY